MKTISLDGKVAIVTGSASGIGRGIAEGLAQAGAHVALADIDLDSARETAAAFAEAGYPKVLPVFADVASKAAVESMTQSVLDAFGRLDILVNNAGVAPSYPLEEFPEEEWDRCVAINLKGYFLCGQAAARALIAQGQGGVIINISSKSGVRGSGRNSAYNATKFGVIGLAQGWAAELAPHKIRVNSILPGNVIRGSGIWSDEYVQSRAERYGLEPTREAVEAHYNRQVPLGRQCMPKDVADMAVFLCSDMASYITGCSHLVDGGQEMR